MFAILFLLSCVLGGGCTNKQLENENLFLGEGLLEKADASWFEKPMEDNAFCSVISYLDAADLKLIMRKPIHGKLEKMYETSITGQNPHPFIEETVLLLAVSNIGFNKCFVQTITNKNGQCTEFYKECCKKLTTNGQLPDFEKFRQQLLKNRNNFLNTKQELKYQRILIDERNCVSCFGKILIYVDMAAMFILGSAPFTWAIGIPVFVVLGTGVVIYFIGEAITDHKVKKLEKKFMPDLKALQCLSFEN